MVCSARKPAEPRLRRRRRNNGESRVIVFTFLLIVTGRLAYRGERERGAV